MLFECYLLFEEYLLKSCVYILKLCRGFWTKVYEEVS